MSLFRPIIIGALFCLAQPVLGHEFWIEPQKYQVESGTPIVANLKNGQNFEGIDFAWFDSRQLRFERVQNTMTVPVTGRAGDVPAVTIPTVHQGLMVLVLETEMATVTYRDWDKFNNFATHKGFENIKARHEQRHLPPPPFREGYRRLVKSLVTVGLGEGADQKTGLEFEFVALANPYTDALPDGLPVILFYRDIPHTNAQIEIFDRLPDGQVHVSTMHTDQLGMAMIPVQTGHEYLLDSVVLRAPDIQTAADQDIVWESLWAAMTFLRP